MTAVPPRCTGTVTLPMHYRDINGGPTNAFVKQNSWKQTRRKSESSKRGALLSVSRCCYVDPAQRTTRFDTPASRRSGLYKVVSTLRQAMSRYRGRRNPSEAILLERSKQFFWDDSICLFCYMAESGLNISINTLMGLPWYLYLFLQTVSSLNGQVCG